jgi:hypothetical protein
MPIFFKYISGIMLPIYFSVSAPHTGLRHGQDSPLNPSLTALNIIFPFTGLWCIWKVQHLLGKLF